MSSLYANILNETQKILLRRKNKVLLVLSAVITIGAALLLSTVHQGLGIYAVRPADFPVYILGYFTKVFMPLFIFMWAADAFAGEIGDRSMKIVLLRPISRFKVFLSKNISLGIFVIILLITVFIFSIISSLFLGAGGGVFTGLLNGIKAYSAAIIPMLALVTAASFIAQFFKTSSGALTTSIILYIASMMLPLVIPEASAVLLSSYTGWHALWLGSGVAVTKLLYAFIIMISSSMIFLAAGFYIFDSRDL